MSISFAVTAYKEFTDARLQGGMLLKCISAAEEHPAIDEIVISNDCPEERETLEAMFGHRPKVRLFHNHENLGVFGNKLEAIFCAMGDWVITCDSDNVMGGDFIDQIVNKDRETHVWYCPTFARPHFDYRDLAGKWSLFNMNRFFPTATTSGCAINTGNQTVYRQFFVDVFGRFRGIRRFDLMMPNYLNLPEEERQSEDWYLMYGACDSMLINIEWMTHGGTLEFCAGLEYDHTVHKDKSGSNYDRAPADKERLAIAIRERLAAGKVGCNG